MIKLNKKVNFIMVVDTKKPSHLIFEGPWEQFEDVVYHDDAFTQRDVDILLYAISMSHLAMPASAFDLANVDARVRGLVIRACRSTYPNFTGRFSSKQITEWDDSDKSKGDAVDAALKGAVDRANQQGWLVRDDEDRQARLSKTYCYYGNRPDLLDESDGYAICLIESMLERAEDGKILGYTLANPYSSKPTSQYATGNVPLKFTAIDEEVRIILQSKVSS